MPRVANKTEPPADSKKRGRATTVKHDHDALQPPKPVKRVQKQNDLDPEPVKKKRITQHSTRTWSANQKRWATDSAPQESIILQLPISTIDEELDSDEITDKLLGQQHLIGTSSDNYTRIRVPSSQSPPVSFEAFAAQRNSEEKQWRADQVAAAESMPIPEARVELPPDRPILPHKYDPNDPVLLEKAEAPLQDEHGLRIVRGFNDDGEPVFFDPGEKIIVSSPEMSDDGKTDLDTDAFSVTFKRAVPPSENIATFKDRQIPVEIETNFNNTYLPYNPTLDRKGVIYKQIYRILPEIYNLQDTEKWPASVPYHCWWCVHTFDGPPVPCPVSYSRSMNTFRVQGCFCSFNCAIAYSIDHGWDQMLVSWLARRWLGRNAFSGFIKAAADPRKCLRAFGGLLTIEEFRRDFVQLSRLNVLTEPLIPQISRIELTNVRPLTTTKPSTMEDLLMGNIPTSEGPKTHLERKKPARQKIAKSSAKIHL